MMREFYAFEKIPFDEYRSRALLTQLICNENYGRAIIIEQNGAVVGYMILGFGFSLEFGGRDALLDELYVDPAQRGRGLGTEAIRFATGICRTLGMSAIHLEADHFNARAHDLYLHLGFKDHERHLMTLWL